MKILESWPTRENITIARVDELPAEKVDLARAYLSAGNAMLPKDVGVNAADLPKLEAHRQALASIYRLKLALLDGDRLVGWSEGWQESNEPDSYFMAASVVVPAYRRKGLYAALASKTLEITKRDGFQSVKSLHVMTNNPILIAKLKLGFQISGFELNARWGSVVQLVHHHNEMKARAFRFRAGITDDPEILKALRS